MVTGSFHYPKAEENGHGTQYRKSSRYTEAGAESERPQVARRVLFQRASHILISQHRNIQWVQVRRVDNVMLKAQPLGNGGDKQSREEKFATLTAIVKSKW